MKPTALANAVGLIDFVLHPFFHAWGWVAPDLYERVMRGFVVGLPMKVDRRDEFDASFFAYWFAEVAVIWILGATVAVLYNYFAKRAAA